MLIDIGFRIYILFCFLFYIGYWLKHNEIDAPKPLFIPRRRVWIKRGGLRLSGWRMHIVILYIEIFLVVPSIYWGFTITTIVWDLGAFIVLMIISSILLLFEYVNERTRRKPQSALVPKSFVQEPTFLNSVDPN